MTEADVFEFIKRNLRLEYSTGSTYCDGDGTGRMYCDTTTIRLMIGDQCLGEVNLP